MALLARGRVEMARGEDADDSLVAALLRLRDTDRRLLSRRESEVMTLLAGGLSNAGIAARLFISPKLVRRWRDGAAGRPEEQSASQ